jgi:hypothetical protein
MNTHQLLVILQRHIGRERGATVDVLVKEYRSAFFPLKATGRDVRSAVQELRMQGHHVCAHPRSGYFIAQTHEELSQTESFLRQRALASLQQVAAMRRVSLPDLIGQQRFLLELQP